MNKAITVRPATISDMRPAYAVFRRSIYDYLLRIALIDAETAAKASVDEAWRRQAPWIGHLWNSAAENWVAENDDGVIVGWAMSVERDDHLELTHFFVEPGIQSKGIGKHLIARAFPEGRGAHKSISATQDPRALSLYLRSGVNYVTTAAEFVLTPALREPQAGLAFREAEAAAGDADAIARIEKRVLGFRRDADVSFLLRQRKAWLAMRGGEPVGFAFGVQPETTSTSGFPLLSGPMAALDPRDVPALIDQVTSEAARLGNGEFSVLTPFTNHQAVSHLLARGAKIDPFYVKVLSSGSMKLDRWIHTGPMFIL